MHYIILSLLTLLCLEGLLKTGCIFGIARTINAFKGLLKALPTPESNDPTSVRTHVTDWYMFNKRGEAYMRNIYREDHDPFVTLASKTWPDLNAMLIDQIYGYYQAEVSVMDAITTSQVNIATLLPMDVMPEVGWHMRGLMRNGGTKEQVYEAFNIARMVCDICEIGLKNTMPVPEEVIHQEKLMTGYFNDDNKVKVKSKL